MSNSILEITPGDIVREVSTGREREVADVRLDLGLLVFCGEELLGWTSLQGLAPTGRRAEGK
jgi:hypothetical protein